MSRFAGVCLLDNPFSIDGVYDYVIPEELAGEISAGSFVTVPFGTANQRRLALVTELRDTSPYKEAKSVFSVCPEEMFLNEEMLGLCAFMKLRTLCSTGDAVRAMIPASSLSRLVTKYALSEEHIPTCSDDVPSSDLFVYEYLRENGEISLDALRRRFGAGVELKLKHLVTLGIAKKKSVLEEAKGEKFERVWQVAIPTEDAYSLIDGASVGDVKLTSDAQKKALRTLLESDLPMTASELCERAGVTAAPLKTLLSKGIVETVQLRQERNPYGNAKYLGRTPIHLNDEQSAAMETLSSLVDSKDAKAALLYGVTGSGKTCVMLSLIDKLLDQERGVIVLLPEIALTPQSVAIFCARYGDRVAVIHSGLSAGERYDAYCRIRDGRADVVIGTRSAVFSPVKNLGAIIIDEEQEHTYKSDQNPKYHTRDIARYRCAHNKALILLSSATPSLLSYQKAKEGT
ncbi:MAG: DEAD/DEAH box helicase family protein, partial [Clostridia bacterium]|nr:DEAD/DEAH box helicase family protein [Clostridia bacterium]